MRLASLKLVGFKSFAESTTLHFKQNRTAIVGPNGCGKSNVIDAIRWVMGESSAKQLRGGNMQDVIFAGTSQRKAVGVASVELRFENTYGKLGGEYNAYQELSVKRQVNREGKSEYFLNGTRCRRKDITDIFLGTGLGPRSYAVIEQGMISRLVDAKPDDMRVFLEEAAGISRYQARRKETVQHLQHTQDNLARLHDIRLELQQQSKTLSRQANQAEKYRQLSTDIYQIKMQALAINYQQTELGIQHSTKELSQLSEQYQQQHQQVEQLDIEIIVLQKQIQEHVTQSDALQNALHEAKQQHEKMHWQQQQHSQQQQDLQAKIQLSELKQQQLQEQQQQEIELQHQLNKEIAQCQQEIAALQDETPPQDLSEWQQQLQAQQQQLAQQQGLFKQWQQQIQQWQVQQAQLQKNLQRIESQQQQIQSQQQLQQREDWQQQLADIQLDCASVQLKFEQLQQQVVDKEQRYQQLLEQYQQMQQQVQQLEFLQKNQQNEIQKVEKLVQQTQNTSVEISQPLLKQLQLSDAGKQHSQWVEKVLAQWLNAQSETAHQYDEQAWQRAIARQVWVDADYRPQGDVPSALRDVPTLSTWIVQPQHSLWQQIFVVENQQQAQALRPHLTGAFSILSQDGFWLGQDWLVNLNYDEQTGADGQLYYQNYLQELRSQQQVQQQQLVDLQPKFADLSEQKQQQSADLSEQKQQLQQLQQQLQQLQQQQTQYQAKIDAQQQQDEQNQLHLQQLQQQHDDDAQELADLQLDLAQTQLKIEQHQPEILRLEQDYQHAEQQFQQAQQHQQEQNQTQQQLQKQLQALTAQLQLLQQSEQFKQQQLEQISEQMIDEQQQLNRLAQQSHDASLQQHLEQQVQQHEQAWQAWQQQFDALQQQQEQMNQQRSEQQQQEQQLRDELENTRLAWQQHKATRTHLAEQILSVQHDYDLSQNPNFGTSSPQQDETSDVNGIQMQQQREDHVLTPAEEVTEDDVPTSVALSAQLAEFDFEKFCEAHLHALDLTIGSAELQRQQQRLQQAEQQLAKIGAVNLVAYSELQQVQQREQQLASQIDDLERTVTQLKTAMHSIDQETKHLFMKTFDAVNKELSDLFPKIFKGGEASLILESDWQSGVKLMARPPGKRNSTLALLSGGEKALTALALVFAIFRLNPAPFCVLDEVDAPLDDANVKRFCDLVQDLSQQVQFIYITHNKVAMTMATDLLGVTMPDAGSSKLVAVSLSEATQYVEQV